MRINFFVSRNRRVVFFFFIFIINSQLSLNCLGVINALCEKFLSSFEPVRFVNRFVVLFFINLISRQIT
jgi:hypothetical protein